MKILADGVEQLAGFPPDVLNVYLVGGILIDSGTRFDRRRVLRQLRGRDVRAHALTHGHPDHQGSSRAVRDALGIPLWCGAGDADAVESGRLLELVPDNALCRVATGLVGGPACPVSRRLVEGDEVAGFRVLETPGHSPGHVSFWRESDRVLFLGDALANTRFLPGTTGLREPPTCFSPDPAQNRRSLRRLLELGVEPALTCFGHGPPLRDPARFAAFLRRLPA
jgi:hydroxyacylglutathione hydrolase